MPLSKEERDALPAGHFAVPGKRKLPINDATHTKLAWDMIDRTQGLSDEERAAARSHVLARAKELGIDTSSWEKGMQACAITLLAMSIELPTVQDHPNRMPFTGVLTFVDTPSDLPVGGSGGMLTYLPRAVAETMLPTLLGMPVDHTPDFDGHDVKRKLGTITSADIVGNELQIGGFFYAADFPQECARIQAEKEDLGFSYEVRAQTRQMGSNLLQIVSGSFTGAAVLYKDKAAYQTTSLAAQAEQETEMTEEQLKALLASALSPVTTAVEALTKDVTSLKAAGETALQANQAMRERVAPHASALRAAASAMEGAGIGLHSTRGHVKVLHHMAACMEAEAATGSLPHIYRDHDVFSASADVPAAKPAAAQELTADHPVVKALTDQISGLGTKMTDMQAAAFKATPAPERKTVSKETLTLLAKGGITEAPKEPLQEHEVDAMLQAAGVTGIGNRIAAKIKLSQEGLMVRSH